MMADHKHAHRRQPPRYRNDHPRLRMNDMPLYGDRPARTRGEKFGAVIVWAIMLLFSVSVILALLWLIRALWSAL